MIHQLKIEIEPWIYSNTNDYHLKVKMYVNNQEFNYNQIIPFDMMNSAFDQMWEQAKKLIKEEILEASNDRSTKV